MVAAAVSAMQNRGFSDYQRVGGVESSRAAGLQSVSAGVRAALGFFCCAWLLASVLLPLANSGTLILRRSYDLRVASFAFSCPKTVICGHVSVGTANRVFGRYI